MQGNQVANWVQLPFGEHIIQVEGLGVDNQFLLLTNQSLYLFSNGSALNISLTLSISPGILLPFC